MWPKWIARRTMQRYWRWQRALTLGVRGMVLDGDGRVLLVRQTYSHGWLLPGGGVEFAETVEASLAREVEEEAGIVLTGRPELLGLYSNKATFPGDHVAVYVIRSWRQARPFKPNLEIAEAGFFAVDALPADTTAGTRRRIDELLGRAPCIADW